MGLNAGPLRRRPRVPDTLHGPRHHPLPRSCDRAQPKGILDPATGQPIGANDPTFLQINSELADRGFLLTTTDDLITWARTAR